MREIRLYPHDLGSHPPGFVAEVNWELSFQDIEDIEFRLLQAEGAAYLFVSEQRDGDMVRAVFERNWGGAH